MQMATVPAHGSLENQAQIREGYISGNQDAAPDEGLDVLELDAQPVLESAERDLVAGLLELVLEGFVDVVVGSLTGTVGLPITAGRPLYGPPAPACEVS